MNQQNRTLKQKVINSGAWVLSGHITSQIIRLGGNLILTRLLVPEMFGVMEIVSVFMMGLVMFSDLGIMQNIIQSKRGEERVYLNTAWTFQILRGLAITVLAVTLSAVLHYLGKYGLLGTDSVYSDRELPLILAVMSLTGLIAGFNSINLAVLNRKLNLRKITLIEVASQVVGLLVMCVLAWYQRNIWSLVIGAIVGTAVKMLLSHHPSLGLRSCINWDKESAKEIFHFGKWIFGASIFTFLAGQGDRLLLGGLVSSKELGIYTIAYFIAIAFKEVVRKVMSSVLYPALSEVVRSRPQDLKDVYYRLRSRLDVVVMIAVGILASTGHLAIDFLYDDRYQDAGWMLEILSLATIFLGITMAGICFMALGDSKSIMILTATSAVFLFISVPIAYYYFGLYGAIVAIALNSVVELPIIFYKMHHYNLLSWKDEFKMWPIFFLVYGLGKYSLVFFDK